MLEFVALALAYYRIGVRVGGDPSSGNLSLYSELLTELTSPLGSVTQGLEFFLGVNVVFYL